MKHGATFFDKAIDKVKQAFRLERQVAVATEAGLIQVSEKALVDQAKHAVGEELRHAPKGALGSKTGYKFKDGIDIDLRGTGKTYNDALKEAFSKTGTKKTDFEVTKWGLDANGKSAPVEWRAKNGAEVNIDLGHAKNGPDVPHIGYQTGGKRSAGGAIRGHIMVDIVPINR